MPMHQDPLLVLHCHSQSHRLRQETSKFLQLYKLTSKLMLLIMQYKLKQTCWYSAQSNLSWMIWPIFFPNSHNKHHVALLASNQDKGCLWWVWSLIRVLSLWLPYSSQWRFCFYFFSLFQWHVIQDCVITGQESTMTFGILFTNRD